MRSLTISAIAVAALLAATASASALDDSRTVGGQGKSGMPSTGAGSQQVLPSPNSEGQGAGGTVQVLRVRVRPPETPRRETTLPRHLRHCLLSRPALGGLGLAAILAPGGFLHLRLR
jgi:hypothetical protein